jgi:hypothetical protein
MCFALEFERKTRPVGSAVVAKRKAKQSAGKPGAGTWLIAVAALVFVLILLLRLMVFVAPHGRHHF